jgi:ribosomal protein L35
LLQSKSAKRKRQLAKAALVDKTDMARIKETMPFA